MAKGIKRALLSLMLFFVIFLSYQPFYAELISIQANENLTNNLVGMMVLIYPYFWIMMGIVCMGLTIYFMADEMG